MQAKIVELLKPKKPSKKAQILPAQMENQLQHENGFEKSRPLSRKEIAELKDQLEDLNRNNTLGG